MQKTLHVRKLLLSGALAVFLIAMAGLTACTGTNYGYTGGTAATVNGEEVKEDTVTKYVQDLRTTLGVTTDEAWAEWMSQQNLTPEQVRSETIDYYIEQTLVKQAAAEMELSVEPEAVDEQVNAMKANFDSEEAWQESLQKNGISEDEYREAIEEGLLKQKIKEKVAEEIEIPEKDILELMNNYISMFQDSRRSSHILFAEEDSAKAQEVLEQIRNGSISFEDAVEYSIDEASKANGGDISWDSLNNLVTEYQDALSELKKGEMSGLVHSQFGWHIILCTDTYNAGKKVKSLKDVPTEIQEYLKTILQSQKQAEAYTNWYNEYKEKAEIEITDFREDLPYNVEMVAEENTEESTGAAAEDLEKAEAEAEVEVEGEAENAEADAEKDAQDAGAENAEQAEGENK